LAPSNDTFALASNESIVIDGANSVSGAPGHQFAHAGLSLGAALLALVFAVFVLRRAWVSRLLATCLALAALPGLVCVLVLRADAPTRRPALARAVTSTLEVLAPHTRWPANPVTVSGEDDGVLFPLLRYALPSRPSRSEEQLEVHGSSLDLRCARTAAKITCESPPW
jgi:hypothetical protein